MQAIEYDNAGDTDFEEMTRNDLKTKAQRPSEGSVLDLIAPAVEVTPAPVVETPPTPPENPAPAPTSTNTPTQSKI